MSIPLHRAEILERLRAEIIGVGGQSRTVQTLPFDMAALDRRLFDHGLAVALHEVAPATPDLAEDAAATLFVAGIAGRFASDGGSVMWAVSRFDLYAPGLGQAGLAAKQTLYVECRDDAEVLAVMEDERLGVGAISSVIDLIMQVMESARALSPNAQQGGDVFWEDMVRLLLRHTLIVLYIATGTISIADIIAFVRSAPRSAQEMEDPAWQARSFFAACFAKAAPKMNPFIPYTHLDAGK